MAGIVCQPASSVAACRPTRDTPDSLRYPLFVRRDLDAFFGLAINNLVDLIIIATVGRTLLQLPDSLILGRILPGAGLSLLVGNLYYSWQARRLALAEGRDDVTAQPFGLNTPTVFLFLYLVMYPVYLQSHDPELAWKVGVAACFLSGVIEAAGAFVGGALQRVTPRAALLATLAGAALAYIALLPTLDLFGRPVVGLVPLAVILLGYFARVRLPLNLPAGLVAVAVGSALAWSTGLMDASRVGPAAASFGVYLPRPSLGAVLAGLPAVLPFVSAVTPLAIMNFMGTLQCVESAAAAGDRYPPFPTMIVNGVATMVGALLGSCFPTTVYIGHPAWKALGARQGYSILNGVVIALVCTTGLMGLVLAIVPKESASAILLFVGLVITAQAFEAAQPKHFPAVAFGLVPHLAAWGTGILDTLATAAGTSVGAIGVEAIERAGLGYGGLRTLGEGSLVTSMVLCATTIALIDRRMRAAAGWAASASLLAWLGLMHSDRIGWGEARGCALGYALMAGLFVVVGWVSGGKAEAG
jgi:AGZA family xanthine/uracil permease-like MFS transporter